MTLASQDDRRRFSRIVFHRAAELRSGAERISCELLDVSLRGALVEASSAFRADIGAPCALAFRLGEDGITVRMDGAVAHRRGSQIGVRCTEIDLDSISHLRRLVELNLGDEDVLHRELSALVGQL